MQYLTEGILPQKHNERYKLKRLVTRYFFHDGVLFKKVYDGDSLRCLGLEEASEMMKEVHTRECGGAPGEENVVQVPTTNGLLLAPMKGDTVELVKKCHNCQVQANLIHTHPQNLHSMVTLWPFHT